MSTRAIIAIPGTHNKKKGYITTWCWNDGSPDILGKELKRHFTKEKFISQLIEAHSFSSIWGKSDILDMVTVDDKITVLKNGRFLLQRPYMGKVVDGKGKNGFFEKIEDMLGCDINYVYVFENNKWEIYK